MENSSLDIDVAQASQMEQATFLDVRNNDELEICRINNALHIPMKEIAERLHEIPKEKTVIVFCHHGGRSKMVTKQLREAGFSNTLNMQGGIHAWANEIDRSLKQY